MIYTIVRILRWNVRSLYHSVTDWLDLYPNLRRLVCGILIIAAVAAALFLLALYALLWHKCCIAAAIVTVIAAAWFIGFLVD